MIRLIIRMKCVKIISVAYLFLFVQLYVLNLLDIQQINYRDKNSSENAEQLFRLLLDLAFKNKVFELLILLFLDYPNESFHPSN